nr:hypothetical protein [Tanacetum cinerariifolium]
MCDLNKTPDLSQRPLQNCPKCRNPVDGQYCQGYTSEPSNDNTNVVNALQKPSVVKQDPGENSSQSPLHINHHCCYGCGDLLEDIFCHQCTCELCGKGAHYGYNCPPIDELPQTLPSFDPICYSGDENSFTYDSNSHFVNDSPNVFNLPLQPLTYSYEFCRNDAYYGHDCPLQVSFTYDHEPCYNQYFNFPQDFQIFQQQYLCCTRSTESDEFIKSSVENLVPIPSEFEGIPDNMYDVPFHDNSSPLDISKDQFEDISDSNDDSTLIDDDSFSIDDIEYVEASPPDSELVSLEVMEIVIPESSSSSLNFLLEDTNTFDNSLPESKTFCFDLEEISSGSTTTHSDSSVYDSFIFDHLINPFPTTGRSDFYEFTNELAHIISLP